MVGTMALPVVIFIMSKFRKIEQGESANGRVHAWYEGFQMLKSGPLFGVGKGNFTDFNYHTAHNSYVLVMAELGTLGYFLWTIILGVSLLMLFKGFKHLQSISDTSKLDLNVRNDLLLNQTLLFSFVGFMATAFFLSRSYTILFFVFCGLAIATYHRTIQHTPEVEIKSFGPYVIGILKIAVGSIFFLYIVTRILL